MNTQKIERKSEQKIVQHGRVKKPWIKIIVLSAIVLICSILLIVFVSNMITKTQDVIVNASDPDNIPIKDIIMPSVLVGVFLLILIGVGIAAFVVNLKTGIKAKTTTNFGPNLLNMLFGILTAVACFAIFAAFMGIIGSKVGGTVSTLKNLINAGSDDEAKELKELLCDKLDVINDKAKLLNILLIVFTSLQVVFATLQLILKNKKK